MDKDILIIGAGLAGSLLAIRMAQKGFNVRMYEKRLDMRKVDISAGRSINLAFSSRGIRALKLAGIEAEAMDLCIPMKGRMIHPLDSEERLSPYSGREGDFINSVSRGGLNSLLLDKAEKTGKVKIFFSCECLNVDLKTASATFKNHLTGDRFDDQGELIFGTDGAGSAVRQNMMKSTHDLLFNFSQQFLRHGYKELSIKPDENGGWKLDKSALHIWPRKAYMIIALPNMDGSFTVTMFHPFTGKAGFNYLNTEEKVKKYFESEYPELIQLMPHYQEEYFSSPSSTLGTIKCFPWQAFGKTLILGDAAHAVVPFYGQGMNASFEDVTVFMDMLEKHQGNWDSLFDRYQEKRHKDTDAIADLALDNFYEMRDHVANKVFIKKRQLEMKLEQTYPDYHSKYSMVTFNPDIPYSQAMKVGRLQDSLLTQICEDREVDDIDLKEVYLQVKLL